MLGCGKMMLGKDVVKRCWTKILVKDVKRDCIVHA